MLKHQTNVKFATTILVRMGQIGNINHASISIALVATIWNHHHKLAILVRNWSNRWLRLVDYLYLNFFNIHNWYLSHLSFKITNVKQILNWRSQNMIWTYHKKVNSLVFMFSHEREAKWWFEGIWKIHTEIMSPSRSKACKGGSSKHLNPTCWLHVNVEVGMQTLTMMSKMKALKEKFLCHSGCAYLMLWHQGQIVWKESPIKFWSHFSSWDKSQGLWLKLSFSMIWSKSSFIISKKMFDEVRLKHVETKRRQRTLVGVVIFPETLDK